MSSFHFFHHPNAQARDQETGLQTLDSIPSWSNNGIHDDDLDLGPPSPPNTYFFASSATHSCDFCAHSDFDSDSGSGSDSDCFPDEEDQMNFVTDLFASGEEEYAADDRDSVSNPFLDSEIDDANLRSSDGRAGFGSSYADELGFGSRVEFALASELNDDTSVTRSAGSSTGGLRVVGIESESDSDVDQDVDRVFHEDAIHPFGDSDIPLFWDCLGFEEQRARTEELEWEQVDERVDERESLSSIIDRIEELSVSSEVSSNEETHDIGEEVVRSLEWEILLAVNNLARSHEFDHEDDSDGVSYLAFGDDYIPTDEYETLFGQFVQNESVHKGSPPAAKAVMENLPSVVLTKEELEENHVVCAVCKDEILVEETVTRLPCCHHYHGDCIVPWLCIRNTCPVCRYELPTDNVDYEQRKIQSGGLGLPQDLQVIVNFQL
ncbi:RING-type E3 ubiquitin transferase [Sarracenia purpurea var. burkii]